MKTKREAGTVLGGIVVVFVVLALLLHIEINNGRAAPDLAPTVLFDIPFHRQEHALSCEAASLKTALYGYGLNIPEADVIGALPLDRTPKRSGIWGDPDRGFVGDINGMMPATGYGVYADPLAYAGLRWKRTEAMYNGSPQQLTEHLLAGRPIVIWGHISSGTPITWRTPEGKVVHAVHGEHTFLVYGFSGSAEQPTGFYVIDPINGHQYWQSAHFTRQWSVLGNMAVVVYPYPKWARAEGDTRVWEISKDGKTRQWMDVSWGEFVLRGGYAEAVHTVTKEELGRFTEEPPVR